MQEDILQREPSSHKAAHGNQNMVFDIIECSKDRKNKAGTLRKDGCILSDYFFSQQKTQNQMTTTNSFYLNS